MKDYYKILEIQPDASQEVLNNAYRALVRKYHPDLYHNSRMKGPMQAQMQEINEAYEILSTPATRAKYDLLYESLKNNPPITAKPGIPWKSILLWALGTFYLVKFLLKPLLALSLGRVLILGGALYLIFRLLRRSRPQL